MIYAKRCKNIITEESNYKDIHIYKTFSIYSQQLWLRSSTESIAMSDK